MSENSASSSKTSEIILVALTDLRDPDWNPRPFLDEAEMQSLVDFINAGGHIPPIHIWGSAVVSSSESPIGAELTHPNHGSQLVASTQGPWDVISGKRRCEAYRRAGKTHIEAIKLDITLEEAKFQAIAANRDNKPFWLGEFIAVENIQRESGLKQAEITSRLGWPKVRVSYAINLTRLLNPATRQLIYQTASKKVHSMNFSNDETQNKPIQKPDWQLTEAVATRLIPLWDDQAPEASRAQAEKIVQTIINRQLTGIQTDELVAHALSGKDLAQFEPAAKIRKARIAGPKTASPLPSELADKVVELGPHTSSRPQAEVTPSDKVTASPSGNPHPVTSKSAGGFSTGETFFWEWLAGISFISQIKSKLKKGETLTGGEKALVLGWRFLKGTGWLIKNFFKLLHRILKTGWKILKEADKLMEKLFGKTVSNLVHLVLAIVLVWGLCYIYHHNPLRRLNGLLSKVSSPAVTSAAVESIPARPAIASPGPEKSAVPPSVAISPAAAISPSLTPVPAKKPDVLGKAAGDVANKVLNLKLF